MRAPVDGLTVRHMPGHTRGLMTMQVETQNSGHFMLNSDLYHVRDVFEQDPGHKADPPGRPPVTPGHTPSAAQ